PNQISNIQAKQLSDSSISPNQISNIQAKQLSDKPLKDIRANTMKIDTSKIKILTLSASMSSLIGVIPERQSSIPPNIEE
ncbi:MAG: hypothetical protein K0S93_2103, partial [Nitrososphaeraceae archaeon]|nr:hypothetical protein [Nitrososphaeraceae archaeon]